VRVWAQNASVVDVVVDARASRLDPIGDGWFAGVVRGAAGSRYGFQLDRNPRAYPDPASRFQPGGPHGLSEVIDPSRYEWHDGRWRGVSLKGQVLYELHVGTCTAEGTWEAAARHLDRLRALGVTVIQMMPIAEFSGEFGWGYDGVCWFAPSHLYGRPDDLRSFVDIAHQHDIGVILDVVYNHLGPDGNYLATYSKDYFTDRYENEWGQAINFDGPNSAPVRDFVLASVESWIREYHIDGLRLDATQQMFDRSDEHILTAIVERARQAASGRDVIVIGENEPQHAELLRGRSRGGCDIDALYNDDFHHVARVALTGVREAYYSDYEGSGRELLAAARHGFVYQGQHYRWQGKSRGTPALDRSLWQFLHFLENHDQVANSASGRRLCELASPGQLRALTALLLLGAATPLLFQGQELGATSPFVYFAHHEAELARQVKAGRLEFLSQFERFRTPSVSARQPHPAERATFELCKLHYDETERSQQYLQLHADLLKRRRDDPTIALQGELGIDGATLDDRSFVLRFTGAEDDDRLLVVSLRPDFNLATCTEPLVAPPGGATWQILWSSEDPAYGGSGTPDWTASRWRVPGFSALLLGPAADADSEDARGPDVRG
jgi:maltooligosyltrehalose trehalohydrolase